MDKIFKKDIKPLFEDKRPVQSNKYSPKISLKKLERSTVKSSQINKIDKCKLLSQIEGNKQKINFDKNIRKTDMKRVASHINNKSFNGISKLIYILK